MSEPAPTHTTVSGENTNSKQLQSRTETANEIRLELLRMEGVGYSRAEIVKHLATKHHITIRAMHYHFSKRSQWQPKLQDFQNRVLTVWNRNEQIYQMAAMERVRASNENARIGALRIMAMVNQTQAELCGANLQQPQGPSEIAIKWDNDLKEYDEALTRAAEHEIQGRIAEMSVKEQNGNQ